MARQPATPTVNVSSRPASYAATDSWDFLGTMANMGHNQQVLRANEESQEFYRGQVQRENRLVDADRQRQLDTRAAEAVYGESFKSGIERMQDRAQQLKLRTQMFQAAAQLKAAEMEQEGREADYALAEPLAQLGSYVGTQNWGSVHHQRQAIISDPRYGKSREVRARVEAIDQMLGHWGGAYDSQGQEKSFLQVSKDINSPDWAVRKEALRLMALNSDNPSGFIMGYPNLTAQQAAEVQSFVKSNPLVTDPEKLNQLKTFETTFRQKLLEGTGNDFAEYSKQLSDPNVVRQMEDARRAILYGHGSDETNYVSSSDQVISGDTWDQLEFYINDRVENSAGLSATRLVSEMSDFFRSSKVKEMSPDELAKVTPPAFLQSINWADGKVQQSVANIAGDAVAKKLAEKGAAGLATLPVRVVGRLVQRVAPLAAKSGAGILGTLAKGATLGAGSKGLLSSIPGIGWVAAGAMDFGMFHMSAGRDMGQIRDSMKVIKSAQAALQQSAAQGSPPSQMAQIMGSLQQAIQTVNTLSERHGVGINLDLNNIVSRQVASRLQGKSAVDEAMAVAYNAPPAVDPRTTLMPQRPQQPAGGDVYGQFGPAQPQ